jgi:hypothetical protein
MTNQSRHKRPFRAKQTQTTANCLIRKTRQMRPTFEATPTTRKLQISTDMEQSEINAAQQEEKPVNKGL